MSLAASLPYDHPFAGGYPRLGGQPLPTDPNAIDYLERVAAADGAAVEVGVAMAVDAFVKGCKADGIWSAIKASCILCGARTISGALVPLVGATPTPYNFASGDYDRSGGGLKGDGATKYLKIEGAHQSSPLRNSAHQALYIAETASTSPAGFMTHICELDDGGLAGDGRTQVSQTSTLTFTRCREGGGETLLQAPSTGFSGIARALAESYERRLSGATATIVDASDGIPDGDLYVFQNGGNSQFSNARLAFYSAGSALDLALLDNRVSTLVSAIAAAI